MMDFLAVYSEAGMIGVVGASVYGILYEQKRSTARRGNKRFKDRE